MNHTLSFGNRFGHFPHLCGAIPKRWTHLIRCLLYIPKCVLLSKPFLSLTHSLFNCCPSVACHTILIDNNHHYFSLCSYIVYRIIQSFIKFFKTESGIVIPVIRIGPSLAVQRLVASRKLASDFTQPLLYNIQEIIISASKRPLRSQPRLQVKLGDPIYYMTKF